MHTWSARRIANAVRAREVSAEEVTRHHLERIAAHEHLHAVITLTPESALAHARDVPLGPLAGVPLLVKDIFDTAGVRTTYGSGIFRDHVPVHSATSVRRLVDAGAIMLGKANLHEFAWGVTSRNRRLRRRRQQRAARPHSRRVVGWQRERARGRVVRSRPRHRYRRLDPPAGRGLRRGRLQARVRQRPRRRPLAARALLRSRRAHGAFSRRLRARVRRVARRAAPAGGRCDPAHPGARGRGHGADHGGVPRGRIPAGCARSGAPAPGRVRGGAP